MPNNHHLVAAQSYNFLRSYEVLCDAGRLHFTLPDEIGAGPVVQATPAQTRAAMDNFHTLAARIVCVAFACETGMKTLLVQLGLMPNPMQPRQGKGIHDLDKLFGQLPPDMQSRVIATTGLDPATFTAALTGHAEAFVQWRYLYERQSTGADEEFLALLCRALHREVAPPI